MTGSIATGGAPRSAYYLLSPFVSVFFVVVDSEKKQLPH